MLALTNVSQVNGTITAMTSEWFLIVLGWLVGIGVSMGILYAVIYSAVLAALRKARSSD